jgi:hypothetical protein
MKKMTALRFVPLFALPVLGGVLMAFVIATFKDDPEAAPQAASLINESIEPQVDPAVEEPTPQATEVPETVIDVAPLESSAPLDDFDPGDLFNLDDLHQYWRDNLPPDLAEILENGFGGQPAQR